MTDRQIIGLIVFAGILIAVFTKKWKMTPKEYEEQQNIHKGDS